MDQQLRNTLIAATAEELIEYLKETGYPETPDAVKDFRGSDFTFLDTIKELRTYNPPPTCPVCKHTGFSWPADRAYAPGHCYSEDGVREFTRLSGYCEWCFDWLMRPLDEDEPEPEYNDTISPDWSPLGDEHDPRL